jgi:hypothetical protein
MPALGAVGASTSLGYVAETSFGVTPASPTMLPLRAKLGGKFDLKRDTFSSKEMSSTRQTQALTYGTRQGSAELPFELSYSSYDDFLEAVMGGTWTTNVLKVGNKPRSFTVEQKWPDINLNEVNTGLVLTGFNLNVKPNAIVEGSFSGLFKNQVAQPQTIQETSATGNLTFTATTIVRATGSWLTDGFSANTNEKITVVGANVTANNGTFTNVAATTACTATTMTFAAATFTVDATNSPGCAVSKTLGVPSAPNTNPVYDSFTGTILVDAVASAIVTGIDLKMEQNSNVSNIVFDATAQQVSLGTVNVSGTLTVRFISTAMKNRFLNGTATDLTFTLGSGGGGGKSLKFDMSKCYFTSASTDTGESELTQSLAFTAIYDGTDATSLMITRIP